MFTIGFIAANRRSHGGGSSGGGGTYTPIVYDTRWGTATDSNGWITFALPSGCRRVWMDSARPNDGGDGLTAATAKKTVSGMRSVWQDGNWQSGDQLMIAGGSAGGTYTDTDDTFTMTAYRGTSASKMTVVQSYDRADPTGATTKYGELTGAAMPVFRYLSSNSNFFNIVNVDGWGYMAVKGIEIKDTSSRLDASSLAIAWPVGNHPGMVYQNCRFNGIGLSKDPSTGSVYAGTNTQNGVLISKCSQWGSFGLFYDSNDDIRVEDFISVHNGWDINAVREDYVMHGGATVFTHAFYFHASNTNLKLRRIVCVDAADGLGVRCGATASQLVSIDNPVGLTSGGKSSDIVAERPDGAPYFLDDAVIMGSDVWICPPYNPGGWAIEWMNNTSGSYARNVSVFDFPEKGFDAGQNRYFAGTRITSAQVPSYFLADKWSGWNYTVTAESNSFGPAAVGDEANYHFSVSNSILEVLPTAYNGSVTSTTTRSSAPAGYKTRGQVYTAMGYTNKSELVNAMLWRPDLPWAQAICGIALPSMGLTPYYQPASPPALVTDAPAIYKTACTDLTASSLSFTRGVPKEILLTGVVPCSRLSCSDLPTGFSMSAWRGTFNGTATTGSNVITGVTDSNGNPSTAGITVGMRVEAKTSAYSTVSLFPDGTLVTATTSTTITCSNNAIGTTSTVAPIETVQVSCGGRAIRYDGTGSGAATPTIHVLETPKDTNIASHTTALTLSIASTDTTAPTLSSPVPSGTLGTSTSATIGATTDEGNGVMYGVVTTSSTAPTKAQVKAGQNNTGSAAVFAGNTGTLTTSGAKTISATGLTASTTYYAHFMHEDASGNQSNVLTSSSFTTAAASSTVWNAQTDLQRTNGNLTIERTANSAFWSPTLGSTSKANGTIIVTNDAHAGGFGPYVGFATVVTDYAGHDDSGAGTGISYVFDTGSIVVANGVTSASPHTPVGVGDQLKVVKAGNTFSFYVKVGSGSFVLQETVNIEDPTYYGPGFSSPMTAGAYPVFSTGGSGSVGNKVTADFSGW